MSLFNNIGIGPKKQIDKWLKKNTFEPIMGDRNDERKWCEAEYCYYISSVYIKSIHKFDSILKGIPKLDIPDFIKITDDVIKTTLYIHLNYDADTLIQAFKYNQNFFEEIRLKQAPNLNLFIVYIQQENKMLFFERYVDENKNIYWLSGKGEPSKF